MVFKAQQVRWLTVSQVSRSRHPLTRPEAECQAIVDRWADGETQAAIAADLGLSKSRIGEIIKQVTTPEQQALVRRRNVARTRARRVAALHRQFLIDAHPCAVCHALTTHPRTCSPECLSIWRVLRYHVDGEFRAGIKELIAAYQGRRPTRNPEHRGFLPGSRAMDAAAEARRRGWPIYEQLPAALRERVEAPA